jgi:O-antigen ligase
MIARFITIKQNDEDSVIRLAVASLAFATVTNTINCIVNVFAPNTPVDTAFCYFVYMMIFIPALPTIIQRLSKKSLYAFFIIVMLYSIAFINPYSSEYAPSIFVRTILEAFPYFILGQTIRDDGKLKDNIFKLSYFVIVIAAIYYIVMLVTGAELNEDHMSFSYYFLPFSAMFLLNTLEKPSIKGMVFLTIAICVHVLTGTRGPLVCLVFCFVFGVFFSNFSKRLRVFLFFIGALLLFYLFSSSFTRNMEDLNDASLNFGIRNRILTKILAEEFLEGSGREDVADLVLDAISERPVLGYGFLGDRSFQNGGYPHNFVLEMWCHYGVFIGSFFILLLIYNFVKVFKNRKINRNLYIMLFSVSYVKLMMSGTYPVEGMWFFLLGLSMNVWLNEKKDKKFVNPEIELNSSK